jgi:hypothetical protein
MGKNTLTVFLVGLIALASPHMRAADHLELNPKLDYNSDSLDGPLITGNHLGEGVALGKPNYVIIYAENCFNSKRQARRTVELYAKYRDIINFVIVDLDLERSAAQEPLIRSYYRGVIPQVVVLDHSGKVVYNEAGEASSERMSGIFDRLLANQ